MAQRSSIYIYVCICHRRGSKCKKTEKNSIRNSILFNNINITTKQNKSIKNTNNKQFVSLLKIFYVFFKYVIKEEVEELQIAKQK